MVARHSNLFIRQISHIRSLCTNDARILLVACVAVLFSLTACSSVPNKANLRPAFDVVYVDYMPAEMAMLESVAADDVSKCAAERPAEESLLARPFSRRIHQPVTLLSRTNSDCETTTSAKKGDDIVVIARRDDWLFVREMSDKKEGWISSEFMRHGFNHQPEKTHDCIDLEWSDSGVRVKNICDRDISDMWICMAKKDRKSCGTNWYQIGRLNAGKTDVLRNMPRHTSSSWYLKICLEPGKVELDGSCG